MNQDTRKDPRAKVLTMTVRYKSATLDEFIEHHSYDVSRGGMFIKTPSPFPPGTLLKFEVKIADEQRLMQGVGRVVWKREASDGDNADKPAGMGVKFIKIDDESRRTIDRLVEARAEGDNAFDQGSTQGSVAPRLPVAAAPTTIASTSSSAPTRPADPPVRSRKATVIGLGAMKPSGNATRPVAISSGPPRQVPPIPEKPAAEPFFPKSDSRAEMPPVEDQTMMKQAKELLADALRYAGGSAEDLKAAAKVSSIPPHVPRPEPHRSVPPRPSKRTESEPAMHATPRPPIAEHGAEEGDAATTIWRANEAAALLAESMKDSMPPEGEEIHARITARPPAEAAPQFRDSEPATVPGASSDPESEKAAAKPLLDAVDDEKSKPDVALAKTSDSASEAKPARKQASKSADSKQAESAHKPKAAAQVPASEGPSSRSRASQAMLEAAQETADAGGGGKGVFALVALAAAAGIAFYLTRPAPTPPPALEPPPEAANVEPPKEVAPPTPAEAATASAAAVESAAAPPGSVSAEAPGPASAAPAPSAAPEPAKPSAGQKPAEAKPPVVRRVVPRRVPKKKVEPPAETPDAPAETPPETPPVAAPEAPPPAPATPPATPPSPTPPPLGDNPY